MNENDQPQGAVPAAKGPGQRRWRQAALFSAALLGGTLAGAGGLSYAAMMTGSVNWHHGPRLEVIQHRIRAALDGVGATTVQEDKVHDIIANGFNSLGDDRETRSAARKEMVDLLRAPKIDRAAVEKLRADEVARYDARSKAIVGMVLDSADQLSSDQRAALADKAESLMARGPGGWHSWGGARDGGPDDDTRHGRDGHGSDRDGDRSPDGARDGRPG